MKAELTITEQINRTLDGRKQKWVVDKMNELGGHELTEVRFSNKKNGHDEFTPEELKTLQEILGTEISV